MEENKERKKPLYISFNVLERKDMIEGFGGREIGIVAISVVIAIVLFFLIYGIYGNIIAAFVLSVFIIGGTILAVRRDQHDESFLDKLKLVRKFMKTQKRYVFLYKDCLYPNVKDALEDLGQ